MAKQSMLSLFSNFASYNRLLQNVRTPVVCQQVFGLKQDTKTMIENLKLPEKPKQPVNPFFRFVNDRRSSVLAKFPNLKMTEIAKKCAEDWKTIDPKQKEKYEIAYKSELESYTKRHLEYESKLSEEQRAGLKKMEDEKKEDKRKRKLRKVYKETGKPKMPVGAYLWFSMEQAKILKKPAIQIAGEIKAKWEALTKLEKEKYYAMHEESKSRYEAEMKTWEAKMLEEGRSDVVRISAQGQKPSRLSKEKTKNTQ